MANHTCPPFALSSPAKESETHSPLSFPANPSLFFLLPALFDGGNAFPPTSTQSLRASVPSCEVPPFYRKGFSSPDLSSSSPANRPASPTDRQAPPDSCRNPADHVSDVINGTAGRGFPFLTDRFGSGCATTTRVSPSFALRAATRVIPLPRGLTSCRSLGIRNPPFKLSARRRGRL